MRYKMASFNFQSFLEKMKEKSAFGIVSEIKAFIADNSGRRLLPNEFVTIIREFLHETGLKLAAHELWKNASEDELDNAYEGLEKYLMNKMYKACFQPAASDDVARDQALSDRLAIMSFVRPEHLDIPPELCSDSAVGMAMKELCKMDAYKAPRDKMVCVLNCCKIINSVLQSHTDKAGADEFFPMLVYVTLTAKPKNLYSNMCFIQRFRNPDKLTGEPGYYFTTLQGAIEFAETLNADRLTIDRKTFDDELNKALSRLEIDGNLIDVVGPEQRLDDVAVNGKSTESRNGGAASVGGDLIQLSVDLPAVLQHDTGKTTIPTAPSVAAAMTTATAPAPLLHKSSSAAALDDLIGSSLSSISRDGGHAAGAGGRGPGSVGHRSTTHGSPPTLDVFGSSAGSVGVGGSRTESTGSGGGGRGRIGELVAAVSEPAVDKFLRCSVEDLTMVDIPVLLSDYKRMARVVSRMQVFLSDQGLHSTNT